MIIHRSSSTSQIVSKTSACFGISHLRVRVASTNTQSTWTIKQQFWDSYLAFARMHVLPTGSWHATTKRAIGSIYLDSAAARIPYAHWLG